MPRANSRTLRLLLSLGVILGVGSTATAATWIDPVAVSGTTIGTANVDLQVQGLNTVTNYSGLTMTNLAAGLSTAGVLTVRNNGNVPLRYYVDASATNPDGKGLATALEVKVTSNGATSGTLPNRTCANGALAGTASSFTSSFVGSAASPRSLAAGASETLCIQAGLPSTAPTTLQTASTAVSFSFTAAMVPASSWADSVAVSGTSLGTPTLVTPTLSCAAQNSIQSVVEWSASTGATGYRLYYGTGSTLTEDLLASQRSYPFKAPTSGTAYVQALYGPVWLSANSNSRTYFADGNTTTCS